MTPEERFERIERKIEFLAGHQAELHTAVQRNSEQIAQLGDFILRIGSILEEQGRRTDERLTKFQWQVEERLGRLDCLAEAQQRTNDRLAEAQQRADERLAKAMERYYSNGRH